MPRIVGEFMVVPYGNHGMILMQSLQVGIGAIQAVAHTIIFQRDDLSRRLNTTPELLDCYRV